MIAIESLFLLIAAAGAGEPAADQALELWNDPRFRRRFVESYLAETEIEPTVTELEREHLTEVMELLAADRRDKALEILRKQRGPAASAVLDFTLANVHFQADDYEPAKAAYAVAIEKHPKFRRAWQNLALIHVRQGDYAAALPVLTRVVELGGHDALTYGLLGFSYASTGNHLGAESAYRMAVLLDPLTRDWQMGLARSLFEQKRYADAAALCASMIAAEPGRADLWLLQGNAHLGLGEPLAAAESFEMVERLGGSTPYSLGKLGDVYYNAGIHDRSARSYLAAFDLAPDKGLDAALLAAQRLLGRGAVEESTAMTAHLREATAGKLDVEHETRLLRLESRLALASGSAEDGVRVLEEIVRLDPLDGESLILLGQHCARERQVEQAAFWFERAAGLEEFEAEAKLQHGRLLVASQRYEEALPLLRRSQALRPRESLAEYLKEVERIAQTRSGS